METMGDRIKTWREQAGLTQPELADIVGVTKSAVSQWENGNTKSLRPENLLKVADTLGHSVRELVTGKTDGVEESRAAYSSHATINRAWLWEAMQEVDRIGTEEGYKFSREEYHESVIWFYKRIADGRHKKPTLRQIREMLRTVTGE